MAPIQLTSSLFAVLFLVVCDVIVGAPLQQSENVATNSQLGTKANMVANQEREIEDLLSLAKSQTQNRPLTVQHKVTTHVEENNGHVTKVQEEEEKVVDADKQQVVSDVKQTVHETPSGDEGKPEVEVETKVDIPSAGVHETIHQQPQQPQQQQADASEVNEPEIAGIQNGGQETEDLTPQDMAGFLYATQQLDAFYPALETLVNQSKMTAEEAEAYLQEVLTEYQKYQARDMEMEALAEKRDAQAFGVFPDSPVNSAAYFGVEPLAPEPMVDEGFEYMTPQEQYMLQLRLQQQQQQQEQQYAYGNDYSFDPLDFLTVLYEAAYGKGNSEAQEILRLLYDRVSRDDNPDDLEQIRDLLLATVTNSLSEEPQDSQQPWNLPLRLSSASNVLVPGFESLPLVDASQDFLIPEPLPQGMEMVPDVANALPSDGSDDDNVEGADLEDELSSMTHKEKKDVENVNGATFDDADDDAGSNADVQSPVSNEDDAVEENKDTGNDDGDDEKSNSDKTDDKDEE